MCVFGVLWRVLFFVWRALVETRLGARSRQLRFVCRGALLRNSQMGSRAKHARSLLGQPRAAGFARARYLKPRRPRHAHDTILARRVHDRAREEADSPNTHHPKQAHRNDSTRPTPALASLTLSLVRSTPACGPHHHTHRSRATMVKIACIGAGYVGG